MAHPPDLIFDLIYRIINDSAITDEKVESAILTMFRLMINETRLESKEDKIEYAIHSGVLRKVAGAVPYQTELVHDGYVEFLLTILEEEQFVDEIVRAVGVRYLIENIQSFDISRATFYESTLLCLDYIASRSVTSRDTLIEEGLVEAILPLIDRTLSKGLNRGLSSLVLSLLDHVDSISEDKTTKLMPIIEHQMNSRDDTVISDNISSILCMSYDLFTHGWLLEKMIIVKLYTLFIRNYPAAREIGKIFNNVSSNLECKTHIMGLGILRDLPEFLKNNPTSIETCSSIFSNLTCDSDVASSIVRIEQMRMIVKFMASNSSKVVNRAMQMLSLIDERNDAMQLMVFLDATPLDVMLALLLNQNPNQILTVIKILNTMLIAVRAVRPHELGNILNLLSYNGLSNAIAFNFHGNDMEVRLSCAHLIVRISRESDQIFSEKDMVESIHIRRMIFAGYLPNYHA